MSKSSTSTSTTSSPDVFVLALADDELDVVIETIESQAAALANPPMTTSELLDGLLHVGLIESVAHLRSMAG